MTKGKAMKGRISIFAAVLFFSHFFLMASEVLINPEKSTNSLAGYDLLLEPVLQVKDIEGKYFFKHILSVKIADDGSIFVLDKKQLLKFTPGGQFVANYYTHGQGPQEATYISSFFPVSDNIIFYDSSQKRIHIINHKTGQYVNEFRLEDAGNFEFLGCDLEELLFARDVMPDTLGRLEILKVDKHIETWSYDGIKKRELITFPLEIAMVKSGDRYFSDARTDFLTCRAGEKELFISNTAEYGICLYNFKENKITKRFSRKYKRVESEGDIKKYAPGGNFGDISIDGKQFFKIPVAPYLLDIQMLLPVKNELWVITSTVIQKDGKNKIGVDVFDIQGNYTDQFFLVCPGDMVPYRAAYWIKNVKDNYLFTAENESNGDRILKKYKILNKKGMN